MNGAQILSVTYPNYLENRLLIPCLCGSSGGMTIRRRDRYGLRFDYKLCLKCGHVRTSNPLTPAATKQFYSTSDYRTMYFPGRSRQEVLLQKTPKPHTRSLLLKYVEELGIKSGSLVEWGCGGGWNLVPFRDAGWQVLGFDYDEPYVELGREVLGLDLHVIPTQDENTYVSASPDVIILNHVLEHAVDPRVLLTHLRSFSKPTTTLVVGIPLLETIPTWHWRDFFHIAHIHYFSPSSFEDVARASGWKISHKRTEVGLFALAISDAPFGSQRQRLDSARSLLSLIAGFLEPKYRFMSALRRLLTVMGLRSTARKIKHLIQR